MLALICAIPGLIGEGTKAVPGLGIVAEHICKAEGAALGDAVLATIDSMADAGRTFAS